MVVFWIIAAFLLLAAMLFVLPPLLSRKVTDKVIEHDELNVSIYKDQLAELERDNNNGVITLEYYERTKHEVERRLLQDVEGANKNGGGSIAQTTEPSGRLLVIALAVVLPLFSFLIYMKLGSPTAVTGVSPTVAATAAEGGASSGDHPDTGAQVEAMVDQLAASLAENPDDIEGWLMLARSYRFQQKHAAAVMAFEKAMPLVETNPQLLADFADTLAMAAAGSLDGRPIRLIQKSLELDPINRQSLWLAGTYHYERGDYEKALSYWRRLKKIVQPGSQEANAMDTNIAEIEARLRAAGRVIPAEEEAENVAAAAKGPTFVAGTVRVDPTYQEQLAPTDTVFIYARAAKGPRMPLAILRKQVQDLPYEFTLDEKMAMMSGMSLADYPQIIVSARISKSGNAMAQSGDFEGTTAIIDVGKTGLDIIIDNVVP